MQTLDELISVLQSDQETHWSALMSKVKNSLLDSDASGIDLLLGAYGGMGSFDDLIICQKTEVEEFVAPEDSKDKNERLDSLRCRAFELATWLKRNHTIQEAEQAVQRTEYRR